jgi:hypothetical protein
VKSAHFTDNLCVVVGSRSTVDVNTEYSVDRVDIDTDSFIENLSPRSESALEAFKENPDSLSACKRFQATLAEAALTPVEHGSQSYKLAPRADVTTDNCDIVIIGDDNRELLDADYRAPTGDLDLEAVLCQDVDAAAAFVRHLKSPDDEDAKAAFDSTVSDAIDTEILGCLLESADFHREQPWVTRWGRSVDTGGGVSATVGGRNTTRSRVAIKAHNVELSGASSDNKFAEPALVDAPPPPADPISQVQAQAVVSANSLPDEPHAARRRGGEGQAPAVGGLVSFLIGLLKRRRRQNGQEGDRR